jgi:hypothetical protein
MEGGRYEDSSKAPPPVGLYAGGTDDGGVDHHHFDVDIGAAGCQGEDPGVCG